MPRLACERSRKTQPQTSRGHAFSRAQRPSSIAANATASTLPERAVEPSGGRHERARGRTPGPAARAGRRRRARRARPAPPGRRCWPAAARAAPRAPRPRARRRPGRSSVRREAAVLEPGGEALGPVEQVVVVLAVERVDEVLHEAQVAVGRRPPARLHRARDEVGPLHARDRSRSHTGQLYLQVRSRARYVLTMNKEVVVRRVLIGAGCALALAGCGSREREAGRPAAAAQAAATPAATPDPVARHGRKLIVFRRVRYEGATLNVMTLYADGFVRIDVPNGGAGGAKFVSRATPRAVRGVRRAIAPTPWRHLSKRQGPVRPQRRVLHAPPPRRGLHRDGRRDEPGPEAARDAAQRDPGRRRRAASGATVHRWGRI